MRLEGESGREEEREKTDEMKEKRDSGKGREYHQLMITGCMGVEEAKLNYPVSNHQTSPSLRAFACILTNSIAFLDWPQDSTNGNSVHPTQRMCGTTVHCYRGYTDCMYLVRQ